jgi:hypothetical protein
VKTRTLQGGLRRAFFDGIPDFFGDIRSAEPGRCSVGFRRIVLKKSFSADDRKFSGPLVCLSRCEMGDHINYRKNDRWRSYRFYKALQRLKSPMRDICEIFGAPRFSSFSTQSAPLRHARLS